MSAASEKRPYLLRILGTWGVFLLIALVLSIPLGPLPPLGNLLSPATGYLRNAPSSSKRATALNVIAEGVRANVSISIDSRGVPHVVAMNDFDLAFGQGYATARDRLWQMELQTAATAGRVSEILGAKAVEFDIKQRKLGFLAAAEAEIEFLRKNDPEQLEMLESYSRGVNAYIKSIDSSEWPLEYKLLGTSPEQWTPLKCALFHKQMIWILTGQFDDFKFTNALQKFTKDELENLFPDFYTSGLPILDTSVAQMSTGDLDSFNAPTPPLKLDGLLQIADLPLNKSHSNAGANGSNNWVVDGVHTGHGYPVLANDPHLDLKLPSIWYEIQLTAPGVNIYGTSLPGLPHVIIGFNENVSWGITNAGVDVIDWYALKFDKNKPTPNYLYGKQWKPTSVRKETIKIRGQQARTIDVLQTHFGPIAKEYELEQKTGGTTPISFAMKWTGHSPSNEFRVFYSLNRARSVVDMKNALRSYEAPGQNFVMADKTGSIGYVQAGRFPMRSHGQGRFVLDGSEPSNEWNGFVPFSHLPQSWSPDRGYLATANQQPTRDAPLGYASGDWGFTSYLRGTRILQRLEAQTNPNPTTISALMALQNDVVDLRAKAVLPVFFKWINGKSRNEMEAKALSLLADWKFEMSANSVAAAVWSKWWEFFYNSVWEKAFPETFFKRPSEDRTTELLLADSSELWPRSANIPKLASLPDLALSSFQRAVETLQRYADRKGTDGALPTWGAFRGTRIPHLANLSGFGIDHLETGGNGITVNATTETHGPSWRMVVTWVEAQPRAWGVYPGGQSGHVGSNFYSNMTRDWQNGELQELLFVQQGMLKDSLTLQRINLENPRLENNR